MHAKHELTYGEETCNVWYVDAKIMTGSFKTLCLLTLGYHLFSIVSS